MSDSYTCLSPLAGALDELVLQETVETLRARYEEAVQPFQQQYDAEGEADVDAHATAEGSAGAGDNEARDGDQSADTQGEARAGEQAPTSDDNPTGSRHRSQDRSRVRSREPSASRLREGGNPFEMHGEAACPLLILRFDVCTS